MYAIHVECPFADLYIAELLKLGDVSQEHPALRARTARLIVQRLQRSGLRRHDMPATNLLLAYCLYFWESFTAGYAFEVYRDLSRSGVDFEAHDIRDRQARMSPYDLRVLGLYGDIKTSLYFLAVSRGCKLTCDFYITRFYEGRRQQTLIVMLKPEVWQKIDGETLAAALEEATRAFPAPVKIKLETDVVVIVDYEIWKTKVLHRQQVR